LFDSPWGTPPNASCSHNLASASRASSSVDEAFCVCGSIWSPTAACCVGFRVVWSASPIARLKCSSVVFR
jgi:hypothetical protein